MILIAPIKIVFEVLNNGKSDLCGSDIIYAYIHTNVIERNSNLIKFYTKNIENNLNIIQSKIN